MALHPIYRYENLGTGIIPCCKIIIMIMIQATIRIGNSGLFALKQAACYLQVEWHHISHLSSLNLSFCICKIFKTSNKFYHFIFGLDSFYSSPRSHGERKWLVTYNSVQWCFPQICSFNNMTRHLINGSHCVSCTWRGRSGGQVQGLQTQLSPRLKGSWCTELPGSPGFLSFFLIINHVRKAFLF